MSHELHDIPPTPRRPSARAILIVGWPLLLIGGFLTVYGGLVSLMLFFASHADTPRIEAELDASNRTTPGRVTAIAPIRARIDGHPVDRVAFRFRTPEGAEVEDVCFVFRGRYAAGEEATVEFLPTAPYHARLEDGHVSFVGGFVGPALWLTVFPGVTLLLAWAAGAFRAKRLLTHGDAAIAEIVTARSVRFALPSMLDVRFRFRDHNARVREGRHWVRERSPLGERIFLGARRVVVIHDREHPARHRLAQSTDFVRTPPAKGRIPAPARRPEP